MVNKAQHRKQCNSVTEVLAIQSISAISEMYVWTLNNVHIRLNHELKACSNLFVCFNPQQCNVSYVLNIFVSFYFSIYLCCFHWHWSLTFHISLSLVRVAQSSGFWLFFVCLFVCLFVWLFVCLSFLIILIIVAFCRCVYPFFLLCILSFNLRLLITSLESSNYLFRIF